MTFWQRSEIYTPILCRLMAKDDGKAASSELLSRACHPSVQMTPHEIHLLSQSESWNSIPLATMRSFLHACNLDFCNPAQMHRADEYLRRNPTFRYLRADPLWESYYLPLLKRWRASYGKVTAESEIWLPVRKLLIRLTPIMAT